MEPIGRHLRKLRQSGQRETDHVNEKKVSLLSIDEQIALLQQQAEGTGSSDDSSDESGNSSDDTYGSEDDSAGDTSENDAQTPSDGLKLVRDDKGKVIRIVSSLAEEERIAPLPAKLLPAARCNTKSASDSGGKSSRKRIRFNDEPTPEQVAISGMEKTVREMLAHYEPVSQDRKPFYCRVCSHQAGSLEELEQHKQTEFHAVALRLERARSYCKHCDKQFTSPDQLKGHVEGKAHKERVARMAARKRGGSYSAGRVAGTSSNLQYS